MFWHTFISIEPGRCADPLRVQRTLGTFSRVSPRVAVEQPVMRKRGSKRMTEKKFGRLRMAVAIGVGLALIPAAMFAATTRSPIDGLAGTVRLQATPTATAKAATPTPTVTATATVKAATAVATVAGAPKSGSGGFLGQESGSNTMTIVLLVAAAASVAVAGRMVTRRR